MTFIDASGVKWKTFSRNFLSMGKKLKILFFDDHDLVFISAISLTGEKKESVGNWYHPLCLKCKKCGRQLAKGNHAEVC